MDTLSSRLASLQQSQRGGSEGKKGIAKGRSKLSPEFADERGLSTWFRGLADEKGYL